jgi:hypothetical protein
VKTITASRRCCAQQSSSQLSDRNSLEAPSYTEAHRRNVFNVFSDTEFSLRSVPPTARLIAKPYHVSKCSVRGQPNGIARADGDSHVLQGRRQESVKRLHALTALSVTDAGAQDGYLEYDDMLIDQQFAVFPARTSRKCSGRSFRNTRR